VRRIEYKYDGNESNVNQGLIESRVQLKEGKEFSPFLADASIKALYASEKFDHVSVKMDEIRGTNDYRVVFFLSPRVKVRSINFVGNENFKEKVLLKKISTKFGTSLSDSTLKSDVEALTQFYHEMGYPYVSVIYDVIKEADYGDVKIFFNVSEGEKLRIGRVRFVGNDGVEESELLKAMRTKKWTLLSFFKKTGIYQPNVFDEDLNSIKVVFKNHGFLDVGIDKNEIVFEHRSKALDIYIPVKLGQQYFVGDVTISGNKLYETEELEKVIALTPDAEFSPAKIDAACDKIRDFYGKSGYINTSVSVTNKSTPHPDRIGLEFSIVEAEKCFVGEVEIRGNSKTRNKVILRELSLAPGDTFDSVRMKNSRAKLMNTGYFSFVDVSPVDTGTSHKKDLRVDVIEAKTGKAGFGGGISTGGEVVGFVEFSQRNFDLHSDNKKFQGGGQKFRSRVQIGKHTASADVNFEEPWLYNRELAVGANLFFHKTNYDKKMREYSGGRYSESRLGGEVYLRKRLWGLWEGKLSYGLEDVKIYNIEPMAPRCFFDEEGHTSVSKLSLTVERDSRDNFIYPTEGSKISVETELAGGPLFGETKYLKIFAFGVKHWLVCETAEQVFSIIGRAGSISPYGGDTTPFFDRFYMGGSDFMKGFRSHDIGPKENGISIGGNTFAYGALEYCFKISEPLRFYLFAEVGFLNAKRWDFSPKHYNTDVGLGLKISVMGMPLKLDFGFPIRGEQNNKHGMRFNYSFGVSF
jgi:outer membrane protein insertion porin family